MKDFNVARRMTVKEYNLRIKGYLLKRLESERDIYLSAFVNRNVKAANSKGEYVYHEFEEFYDYEKRKKQVLSASVDNTINPKIIDRANRVKELRERGGLNV